MSLELDYYFNMTDFLNMSYKMSQVVYKNRLVLAFLMMLTSISIKPLHYYSKLYKLYMYASALIPDQNSKSSQTFCFAVKTVIVNYYNNKKLINQPIKYLADFHSKVYNI